MSGGLSHARAGASRGRRTLNEGPLARGFLIFVSVAFLALFVAFPLVVVFISAFQKGVAGYLTALVEDDTLSAIRLTLVTAAIAVPLNVVFGMMAAWLVAKYEFWGKNALITLIDLPFSVSPVISGLVFVLLFGAQGLFGDFLREHGIKVIFAVPGIVLATTFVTFPLVAREVLSVMQAQGSDEEEAALTLGASGLQIFVRVTLPKVRWGLFYGVILCNARAMGEFGAVSVVSGHIRGETNTMPLQVEILYNEYAFASAFAVASLLAGLSLVTLAVKKVAEWSSSADTRSLPGQSPAAAALAPRLGAIPGE